MGESEEEWWVECLTWGVEGVVRGEFVCEEFGGIEWDEYAELG